MTNPKLYYDDPLAAAYMAREFDIKLICYPTARQIEEYESSEPWDWMDTSIKPDVLMIGEALESISESTGKAYVHPDSHHIFEPKDGDLLRVYYFSKKEDDAACVAMTAKMFSVSHNTARAWLMDKGNGGPDYHDFSINSYEHEIIQRNGKAFFMPERE